MRWLRRARRSTARTAGASPDGRQVPRVAGLDLGEPVDTGFVCSTCGRTDLPPAGGWEPPICSECDAAINFDAIVESGFFEER